MIDTLKLCLITDSCQALFIHNAILGGVTAVQYRDKTKAFHERKDTAQKLQALLQPYQIPLFINDDVLLAKEINAEGVHLGQSDLSIHHARELLGPDKIIGLSIENVAQLAEANTLNTLNYVAASALFPTPSKTNCTHYWGLDGLKKFVQHSTHPAITIGGINVSNIGSVMQCGVVGVAVIRAIHNSAETKKCAQELRASIDREIRYARKN